MPVQFNVIGAGSSRGPADLQSAALPLSYAPESKRLSRSRLIHMIHSCDSAWFILIRHYHTPQITGDFAQHRFKHTIRLDSQSRARQAYASKFNSTANCQAISSSIALRHLLLHSYTFYSVDKSPEKHYVKFVLTGTHNLELVSKAYV